MAVPLLPITINSPGLKGLNTQLSSTLLDAGWATELTNAVFDSSGRIASRKGYSVLTNMFSPGAFDIKQLFCYETLTGGTTIISSANNKLFKGTTALTDITGTITTPTANNWDFVSFNNTKIIGFQTSHTPIVSNAAGNFANLVATDAGSVPTGNTAVSAFGRVWATAADETTIKYSGLLDETKWAAASGAGSLDTLVYWPKGKDYITCLTVWEDKLVVFGQRNILVYDSPDVVANLVLHDIIEGVGCIARDSVQQVGTDVLFLSETGVRSLKKTLITTKAPLQELSNSVRDSLLYYVTNSTYANIRSVYNSVEGFYLLIIPSSTQPISFCFDVKGLQQYNELAESTSVRVSTWNNFGNPTAVTYGRDLVMYTGVRNNANNSVVAYYTGYLDNTSTYLFSYKSPWMDFGSQEAAGTFYKIPKKAIVSTLGGGTYSATMLWSFDFSNSENSETYTVASGNVESLYGVSQYNVAQWNANNKVMNTQDVQMSSYGQFIRLGYSVTINSKEIALQKIDLYLKKGRTSI
jgi:hypothetical protein